MTKLETTIGNSTFTPLLDSHLSTLLHAIDIPSFSRLPPSRLLQTAVPHISLIELVNADDFARLYDPLYVENFPKRAERESSDLIVTRLRAQFAGQRAGLAPYRIVGLRANAYPGDNSYGMEGTVPSDSIGTANNNINTNDTTRSNTSTNVQQPQSPSEHPIVIGAAQFSVLFLPPDRTHAVPYLQYIYIHPAFRRKDMAEVLHTFILAIAEADGAIAAQTDAEVFPTLSPHLPVLNSTHAAHLSISKPMTVPFTLFETEPPGHGDDEVSREYARMRAGIHTRAGGIALVLRKQNSGRILSAHVQPGLEGDDQPLTLVWVVRPSPRLVRESEERKQQHQQQSTKATSGDDDDNDRGGGEALGGHAVEIPRLGSSLIQAYYQSLRDEGFPEKNIALAESIVAKRAEGSVFELMPLEEVLPFTAEDGGVS